MYVVCVVWSSYCNSYKSIGLLCAFVCFSACVWFRAHSFVCLFMLVCGFCVYMCAMLVCDFVFICDACVISCLYVCLCLCVISCLYVCLCLCDFVFYVCLCCVISCFMWCVSVCINIRIDYPKHHWIGAHHLYPFDVFLMRKLSNPFTTFKWMLFFPPSSDFFSLCRRWPSASFESRAWMENVQKHIC